MVELAEMLNITMGWKNGKGKLQSFRKKSNVKT